MTNVRDPYAPIEKVPLLTQDGMKSRGYTVRIEDDSAPVGWSEVGVVSEDYLQVPNKDVRSMAHQIADLTDLAWNPSKQFFDGKGFVYALTTECERASAEVVPGDVLSLGLMFENSYDGSRRLAVNLFANRLACSNGMLVPQFFARLRFKHNAASAGWEAETRRALSMIGRAGSTTEELAIVEAFLLQQGKGLGIRAIERDDRRSGYWLIAGSASDVYSADHPWSIWFWRDDGELSRRWSRNDVAAKIRDPGALAVLQGDAGDQMLVISDNSDRRPSTYILIPV